LNAGETFHSRSPSSSRAHLYIAITDPDAAGNLVIANVTSQGQWKDQSCILNVGDHPYIKKESVINYAEAIVTSESALSKAARQRVIELDVPVSPQVLAKIQAGALASRQTESKVKAAVQTALGK
jgi:CMP-2-keto-3-deoxyoctulosonic acid synthetase